MNSSLLVLLLASSVTRLPPIDQCTGDAAFAAFRAELANAADRRDVDTVMAMVDDNVLVDFGGGQGKEAFAQDWKLDDPDKSGLWSELKTILRLGCIAENEGWHMPSFGSQLDAKTDPVDALLAIDPGSALRSEPRDDGEVVAKLDWDVLKLKEVVPGEEWFLVSLEDGRTGYVRSEQVRSPIGYRIGVQSMSGMLRITTFVAGD